EHDLDTVAVRLNVRTVLSGRVTRRGASLIINTELIEVKVGRRLWGEEYSRAPSEIFTIERDVTTQIFKALRLTPSEGQVSRSKRNYAANLEAHLDYLK